MLKYFNIFIIYTLSALTTFATDKIIIAHRGASGYLPEHTIAAKAMAYAMGVDYIEQDVVMSKDNHLIVLHDHYLDRVTDVQTKFPDRIREDGRYYVIDFTLSEIKSLNVTERYYFDDKGTKIAVFEDRFPLFKSYFKIHTLEEEIELIQGLNNSTGGDVGIYTEAKSPSFHLSEGKDLSKAILETFKKYGYEDQRSKAFYQTFEIDELKRVYNKILPILNIDVKLIQLMGKSDYYSKVTTIEGLKDLSLYAYGIGPSLNMIIPNNAKNSILGLSSLVADAHSVGMKVHPYTFRQEGPLALNYATNYENLLDIYFNHVGVDGVFTDFPDLTVKFLMR
ncbi:MAG: glycerophosphodiester phosphodiesterase [Emcibacteraceae bacterium]|nr:glycerophosphodiester phosphodiesterase [Emcibacteraceae bacterium]